MLSIPHDNDVSVSQELRICVRHNRGSNHAGPHHFGENPETNSHGLPRFAECDDCRVMGFVSGR